MANPQKENGHIPIANEIAEWLAYYRLSGQEYQVLWVIWRKTWGWHKKEDWIALSQFFDLTKMKKPSIIKALNKLNYKNIISKMANDNGILYRFNKDYSSWKPLAKRLIVSNLANGVSKKANKSLAKRLPTKDNYTKDTITKDNPAATAAGKEINEIISLFKEVNPSYRVLFGNKSQRGAVERMLAIFGREKLEDMINALPAVNSRQYWPKSTTPCQLERNIPIYKAKNDESKLKVGSKAAIIL